MVIFVTDIHPPSPISTLSEGRSPSPPVTLGLHGVGDLDEASDVGAGHERGQLALGVLDVLLGGLEAVVEAVLHDGLQLLVDLLGGPADALRVLRHLETRNGDASGVGGLAYCTALACDVLHVCGWDGVIALL